MFKARNGFYIVANGTFGTVADPADPDGAGRNQDAALGVPSKIKFAALII